MLDYRILGALEVSDGAQITTSGRNPRSLLTLLLLRPNQTVSAERLINEMWGEQPPKAAAASLQNAVAQLRKLLGPEVLLRRPSGYVLALEPDQVGFVGGDVGVDRWIVLARRVVVSHR